MNIVNIHEYHEYSWYSWISFSENEYSKTEYSYKYYKKKYTFEYSCIFSNIYLNIQFMINILTCSNEYSLYWIIVEYSREYLFRIRISFWIFVLCQNHLVPLYLFINIYEHLHKCSYELPGQRAWHEQGSLTKTWMKVGVTRMRIEGLSASACFASRR